MPLHGKPSTSHSDYILILIVRSAFLRSTSSTSTSPQNSACGGARAPRCGLRSLLQRRSTAVGFSTKATRGVEHLYALTTSMVGNVLCTALRGPILALEHHWTTVAPRVTAYTTSTRLAIDGHFNTARVRTRAALACI